MIDIQIKINKYFNALDEYIKALPSDEKAQNFLWFHTYYQFYEAFILTEDGNASYGITTEWQLQQFIIQFERKLKKTKLISLYSWSNKLEFLEYTKAKGNIDITLLQAKKNKLLNEIGEQKLKDWEKWLPKYIIYRYDSIKNKYKMGEDFKKDQRQSGNIEDLQERLLFLKKCLKIFKQNSAENWVIDSDGYEIKMQEEIKYTQELISSKPVTQPKQSVNVVTPIWWKRSDRLLRYLMDELAKLDYIDSESHLNKLIKQHFVNKDKKPFTDSIAQNSSGGFRNKGTSKNTRNKPKGHEGIDNLIQTLKDQPE